MVTSTWFTYGRNTKDVWLEDPIDSTVVKCENLAHHVGKFKHKVFQSALGRKFEDTPKIYLYQGFRRIKCERTETQTILHFADKEILEAWKKCKRSKLGKTFDEQYSLDETNKDAYMYIFNKKD